MSVIQRLRFAMLVAASIPVAGYAQSDTVLQRSFVGPVTRRTVLYNIYLPEGYASSSERYPVVYHLHGIGGSQGGQQNVSVPNAFRLARQQNVIGRVIIVFPNGYTDAFWADSHDSTKPAETNLVSELIPHVDSVYRTLPLRRFRIIEGFSMGGYGAAKFMAKYPSLFRGCVVYDGAMIPDWNDFVQFHASLASSIFNNDSAYYYRYDPYRNAALHAPELRDSARFRVAQAALGNNLTYYSYLASLQLPSEYVQTTCGHDVNCLMTQQGIQSAAFIQSLMSPATAVDGDDGALPGAFALERIYPNPFNPTTTIQFRIPTGTPGHITMEVFDLLGRPVATLVNEERKPGVYGVQFDGSRLSSGVYLVRLRSNALVEQRCMILLK